MMNILAGWFGASTVGRALVGALAMLAAILVVLQGIGRTSAQREREKHAIRELRQAAEARRRMDHADIGHHDIDDDREWLRARGSWPPSK
jgi:type II secretory pathway pseudopilin PulG